MIKFLDKFLELKNEEEGTKKFTLLAVVILTVGLAFLSISGAFAKSSGDLISLTWIPRVAYACVVLGLELLAAVLFMRAMRAQDKVRMWVCLAVLPFLVWANVQNAKDGLHFIMPNTFGESSVVLNAKADLAAEEAVTLQKAQDNAVGGTGEELERVRKEIADLKTEQQLMASMSPEGISKAQKSLIAQGLYFGTVDGISEDKTESAMRARGEAITRELATLKAREDGLMQGQASPVMAANTNKRLEEIANRDKARVAADAELRAEIIFWVAEFARNLLLWAAVTSVSAAAVSNALRRAEEIENAEHEAKLAAIRAAMAVAATPSEPVKPVVAEPPPTEAEPEPAAAAAVEEPETLELNQPAPEAAPEAAPEPEPVAVPPPPEPVEVQHPGARAGGQASQHLRKANSRDIVFVVGDWRARDAVRVAAQAAAKIAAE